MLLSNTVNLIYISQVGYISVLGVLKDHELKAQLQRESLVVHRVTVGTPRTSRML